MNPRGPLSSARPTALAAAAGSATKLVKNGGTLEKATAMANHASTRTTQLYDRRR